MKRIALAVAAILALTGSAMADYKLDAAGKCRDEKNKFAKAELCKPAAPAAGAYKLDAKGKCRDAKGKFADAKLCKA